MNGRFLRFHDEFTAPAANDRFPPLLDATSIYLLDVRVVADFMDEFDLELAEWVMP